MTDHMVLISVKFVLKRWFVRLVRIAIAPLFRSLRQRFLKMEREVYDSAADKVYDSAADKISISFSRYPLISVALSVKNGLPHIRKTIEALERQTWPHFELVVQDGVSTDGTLEYLKNLKTKFPIHLVSEPDTGLAMGYSRALRRCKGELVTFTASDEYFHDDALTIMAGWYEQFPDAVMIYGGVRMIYGPGKESEFHTSDFSFVEYLRNRMCPPGAACMFNRKILGEELRLDESMRTCPDFDLMCRLALRYGEHRIVRMGESVSTARADEVSMTFRPESYMQFIRDKTTVVERMTRGELRELFLDHMRREILASLHLGSAMMVYSIRKTSPLVRHHVQSAAELMPGMPALKEFVRQIGICWDAQTGKPVIALSEDTNPVEKEIASKELFRITS